MGGCISHQTTTKLLNGDYVCHNAKTGTAVYSLKGGAVITGDYSDGAFNGECQKLFNCGSRIAATCVNNIITGASVCHIIRDNSKIVVVGKSQDMSIIDIEITSRFAVRGGPPIIESRSGIGAYILVQTLLSGDGLIGDATNCNSSYEGVATGKEGVADGNADVATGNADVAAGNKVVATNCESSYGDVATSGAAVEKSLMHKESEPGNVHDTILYLMQHA
jgi:hypothetical protein